MLCDSRPYGFMRLTCSVASGPKITRVVVRILSQRISIYRQGDYLHIYWKRANGDFERASVRDARRLYSRFNSRLAVFPHRKRIT
jgi:hypothetical protein